MSMHSQGRWHALRMFVSRPAVIVICAAAIALAGANAALLSLIHAYAPPDRVATGLVAAVDLVRVLFTIWLGMHPTLTFCG